MNTGVRAELRSLLVDCIQGKVRNYNPETESKPFFEAIFSKQAVNLASLIQSFYTSFGTSIYEQMAVILARNANYYAEKQHLLLGRIDSNTENLINNVHLEILRTNLAGSKKEQTEIIRRSIIQARPGKDPESVVDLFIRTLSGAEYYFDITSAKPNIKEFRALKKKLLRWVALRLSTDKSANVSTILAIPYNPYYPKPYARWTSGGIFDSKELLVGPDFWNFVAGENIYDELLGIFKEVGNELRPIIDKKIGF